MPNNFSTEPFQKRVEKPWGYEIIYTPENDAYTGKIEMIKTGKRTSEHFHDQKLETLCLFSGSAIIWLEDAKGEIKKIPMEPFKGYTVQAGQKHRFEAIEDAFILEASMPEIGMTVRVEDDFARGNEDEQLRKQDDRGWKGDKA